MANKKRKVSHIDFLHCHQYFERAIQSGRFLDGGETDTIHNKAKQHFLDLPRQENDEQSIQALQNWIDQFVDNETWGKCYRSLNQRRYLDMHDSRTININEHTHVKLKSYAQKNNINLSDAITNLLDGCILSNKEEPNHKKLQACADYRQVSPETLLENLIDSECKSIEYAKVRAAEALESIPPIIPPITQFIKTV